MIWLWLLAANCIAGLVLACTCYAHLNETEPADNERLKD